MPLGMKLGGTPGDSGGEINFDLAEETTTKTEDVTGDETIDKTFEKNDEGEIVVPEATTEEEKIPESEVKAEEETKIEPEGLTPIQDESKEEDKDSSLTPQEIQDQGEDKPIEEQKIIDYLNEKYGKEYSNLDEFNTVKEADDPLKDNPYLKGLAEWSERTGRPIEDYVKFQKDYKEMSDNDVVREYLQMKYPTLTDSDINVEMNKYISAEFDSDEDVASKRLELKKISTSARSELDKLRTDLDKPLPKQSTELPTEVQKNLEVLKEIQTKFETNKQEQDTYRDNISQVSQDTRVLPLKLSDDLSLNFNINEVSRGEVSEFIQQMPHWTNEDGSKNVKAVVEDGIKIKHFDRIIQLVYEQGINSGKDSLIEQSKNSTLGKQNTKGGSDLSGKEGAQIEGGTEGFFGGARMTIR